MKTILSGNEAIARGAFEAGVTVATAYPGTPSTEILENLAAYPEVNCSWSPNEKVALEVAAGASLGGARVMVTMKHVGLNVASDPFMTLAYTGVEGGFVLVCADDPGMFSSQNEQDNRYYARMANVPLLEPADSEEARLMVKEALDISEKYDTPVILRTTTRISHSRSVVETVDPISYKTVPYDKKAAKYVMLPAFARLRHEEIEKRRKSLEELAATHPMNVVQKGSLEMGIIAAGISYLYAKEAFPEASFLKLGLSYPLSEKLIKTFASQVKKVFVVEELEPLLEKDIKAMGIAVQGKELLPRTGELRPEIVANSFKKSIWQGVTLPDKKQLPGRPPLLCPGCGHRGALYALKRLKLTITGDIGCYTLGALPPLEAMDTCICMGASIGVAFGMEKADPEAWQRTVAILGDSTFLHSGVTALMDIVYNEGKTTVVILDNSTTAMTGHQDHPGTGQTLQKKPAYALDLETLTRALGIKRVRVENPLQLDSFRQAIKEELAAPEPSVVIARYPCALKQQLKEEAPLVLQENCIACKACLGIGCPALSLQEKQLAEPRSSEKQNQVVALDDTICNGCGLCTQICRYEALQLKEGKDEE